MKARYIPNTIVSKGAQSAGWLFGEPVLRAALNGWARWNKGSELSQTQKGGGWSAELYGGVQTGDDWAACYIPVNELPVTQFDAAQWAWYQTATQTMGLGMVVWLHDPNDFDKRVEVTQVGGATGLDKSAGQNSHEFDSTVTQMFYYGENVPVTTGLVAGTQYTWDEFQADAVFSTWVIYRVSFDWGWEASGTFSSVYLEEVKLLGMYIPLRPSSSNQLKTVITTKTLLADTAYDATDVMSESTSAGTDWDFDFGGPGYIMKAVLVSATTGLTARVVAFLYSNPPTCALNDHAVNTGPVAADVPYFLGTIDFPALTDIGTAGLSYAVATLSTYGNLPIMFNCPKVYVVLVTLDSQDFLDDTNLSLSLSADMEDN